MDINYHTSIHVITERVEVHKDGRRIVTERGHTVVATACDKHKKPNEADKYHEQVVNALLVLGS